MRPTAEANAFFARSDILREEHSSVTNNAFSLPESQKFSV